MLNDLYFKTTYNIRPHFLGPMGGLKIEVSLYRDFSSYAVFYLETKDKVHMYMHIYM